jgi:uncharacterized repeat protein (TIGR03803 family)
MEIGHQMRKTPAMKTQIESKNRKCAQSEKLPVLKVGVLVLYLAGMVSGGAQTHWVLHQFAGADGKQPSSLVLSGTTLFGTTMSGGSSNRGTVFRLNTDGSAFTMLKQFTGSDGSDPLGGLALSGTTLYGTTSSGGNSNCGTVFKLATDGREFTVLKEFTGSDGIQNQHRRQRFHRAQRIH